MSARAAGSSEMAWELRPAAVRSFVMRRARTCLLSLTMIGLACLGPLGCASGTKDTAPPPPPVVSATPNASVAPSAAPVSSAPVDASAPAASAGDPPEDPACGGSDVDLLAVLANKRCRPSRDAAPTPASAIHDVKVTLTPSITKVAPGGHVDLTLEIANGGAQAVPLYFDGDLTLDAVVSDAKGARVRPPQGEAPKASDPACKNKDCRRQASHVLLAPGGKAHARVGWEAVKTKWPATPPPGCCIVHVEPAAAGPLAAGTYKVKIPLPYESAGNPADPEVEIRVAK